MDFTHGSMPILIFLGSLRPPSLPAITHVSWSLVPAELLKKQDGLAIRSPRKGAQGPFGLSHEEDPVFLSHLPPA